MSMPSLKPAILLSVCALLTISCGKKDSDPSAIALTDPIGLDIVLATPAQLPGLQLATDDLITAFATIRERTPATGQHTPSSLDQADAPNVVLVTLLQTADDALGQQGYRLKPRDFGAGRSGVEIVANHEVGAMYALYDLTSRLGVQYYHPEQTFFPTINPDLSLPKLDAEVTEIPRFTTRGFHEHTQHPIIMSDAFMIAEDDNLRRYASNYLKWLARNRQNASSFHLLKTVDITAWRPYIADIIREGQGMGIKMGVTLSFADQQQNNFRLIGEESQTGSEDPLVQITKGIDNLLEAGFDFLTLQIGTSEFTKPSDDEMLGWVDTAQKHLREQHPNVELLIWIHPPCELEADDGSLFFHLPLRSDPSVGALVHTTMFYTVEHHAPVYDCENFRHQQTFMEQANGKRRQVFYPETAWWLGFDNNLPLTLPITGWSRQFDIQKILSKYEIEGHINFTTGREWLYWQYDHYLTYVTWDASISWEDYLMKKIAPMYGEKGPEIMRAINEWTELQVDDFYEKDPLIYFYLAGELTQDEIGEQVGVLARRPKLAYNKVLDMSDEEFSRWQNNDLDRLRGMLTRYQPLLDIIEQNTPQNPDAKWLELTSVHKLYLMRIAHAIALYEGVAALRPWAIERRQAIAQEREPSAAIRQAAQATVNEKLAAAKAISAQALSIIQATESTYRYPLDLLAKPKPSSLTSYKIGYLEETSRAYFWTRRDVQLQKLAERSFDMSNDAWSQSPDVFYTTNGAMTTLRFPNSRIAATVFRSFVPNMLFGLVTLPDNALSLLVAEDFNQNLLPDEGTEQRLEGTRNDNIWTGQREQLDLRVRSSSGDIVDTLRLEQAEIRLNFNTVSRSLEAGELLGQIDPELLIDAITDIAGIDRDGAANLLKGVYDISLDEPLPNRLNVHFSFRFQSAL